MDMLEIEVKFHLNDMESVRNRIKKIGGTCLGKSFEKNIRFENAANNLVLKNSLLRLRQDTKAKLTYKSKPRTKDKDFKIHRELEVEVSDFSTTQVILESIGFHQEQVYEKWRETFKLKNTVMCLDQMPYGNFLEIEGEKNEIRRLSRDLELKWEHRLLQNYLEIFNLIKQKMKLPFMDVTFNNFKNVQSDFGEFFESLRVEKD